MDDLRRPEVTLTRSSAGPSTAIPTPSTPIACPAPRRRAWLALALTGFGLLLAGTSTGASVPSPPPDAELVVLAADLSVSQGGVLVLPVELRNRGPALRVSSTQTYAEPVVEDTVLQAPSEVPAFGRRRFVAIVAPDCRLLRPGSQVEFRVTALLRVAVESVSRDLVVDLAAAQGVRERVAGVCRDR